MFGKLAGVGHKQSFMDKINQLSHAWRQWIVDNLALGCSHASMIEAMVQRDFDPDFAGQCVSQAAAGEPMADAGLTAVASQQGYVYEPSRIGRQGSVIDADGHEVRIVFRTSEPALALFEAVLSGDECEELISLSRLKLARSTIVDPTTGREEVIGQRSSEGAFFRLNENDFIARLDRRIAALMNWPIDHGEGIQILRYGVGGEYQPHFDYFVPSDPGSQAHLQRGGQRVSTLVMYLNDVPAGGETVFPALNLSVVPKKGSAVYFEYCNSLGQVDAQTLHGGAPVSAGEKWIATKWMRQRRYV